MARPITLEQARARYPHRFTMEHVPDWVRRNPRPPGADWFHAPQHRNDSDWYANTLFPGESELADRRHCYSTPTWPLGERLAQPFIEARR